LDDMGLDMDDDITIRHITNFIKENDLSWYLIDVNNNVFWHNSSKDNNIKCSYSKISNNHIYPITDEVSKNEIRYTNKLSNNTLDWASPIYHMEFSKLNEIHQQLCKMSLMSHDVVEATAQIVFIDKISDGQHNYYNLNKLVALIYLLNHVDDDVLLKKVKISENCSLKMSIYLQKQ